MITGILVLMMCECYNNKKLNALLLELHIWNIYWENKSIVKYVKAAFIIQPDLCRLTPTHFQGWIAVVD